MSLLAQQQQFKSRVIVAPSGCWEGRGAPMRHGYKRVSIGGVRDYLHRWSYRLFKGEIPEGFDIDHLCKNRGCGNPDHLEAVDHRTNVLRGDTFVARQAAQTACRKGGHPLVRRNNGKRHCPTCKSDARRGTSTSQESQSRSQQELTASDGKWVRSLSKTDESERPDSTEVLPANQAAIPALAVTRELSLVVLTTPEQARASQFMRKLMRSCTATVQTWSDPRST